MKTQISRHVAQSATLSYTNLSVLSLPLHCIDCNQQTEVYRKSDKQSR